MLTKEAIVLAGGLGTRLQDLLPGIPKCMAPIRNVPFLTYVLDYLEKQQINKVILSVGYHKEHIINYFGAKYKSILIEYSSEAEPLGTGGALKKALLLCTQEDVFVINGDTYFIPDLEAMEKIHKSTFADISIAVKYMNETARYGLIKWDEKGRINEFNEKVPYSGGGWINGGIYLIKRRLLETVSASKFSLERDIFKLSCSEFYFQSFQTEAFFLDIGIPEDYQKAQSFIMPPGSK